MKHILFLLTSAALADVAFAQALVIPESTYRTGMPEVLTPAPALVAPGVQQPVFDSAAFRAAYAKAGHPTIALLWNREFTDTLAQGSASQISIDTTRTDQVTAARMPGYAATQVTGTQRGHTTITAGEVRTLQNTRNGPVERVDLQMRSAFIQALASQGVRVVDRNVVMRTTAARQKGGGLDSLQIETEALSKHAMLLMEVLNTRDNASPTGWAMYVSIKHLVDGVVLAEGYMDGVPPDGMPKPPPKFEADPRGGFREVAAPAQKIGDVARAAAEQTLVRLSNALAR